MPHCRVEHYHVVLVFFSMSCGCDIEGADFRGIGPTYNTYVLYLRLYR